MGDLSKQIREAAKKLFEEDKVDLIIGFEDGSLPLRTTPCFIRRVQDADRLVWNGFCENNLATYLPKKKDRIGIVVKGCDSRSIVGFLKEKQIARENLVIIGVPCEGMIDRKKVEKELKGRELLTVEETAEEILVKGEDYEEKMQKRDLLPESCETCTHRNPVLYDVMIGEPSDEQKVGDPFEPIRRFEGQDAEERWAYFSGEAEKCIRCYACRNACPICYCEVCYVDSSEPQWFGKSIESTDTQIFHIVRAFHTTGRCVDCGACVRACPMDVDLRFLNKKIEKDVLELFSFEAGEDPDQPPPLTTYKQDDPEEFIK
jgi:ferredoxin